MKDNKPLIFLFTCVKDGRQYIQKLFDSILSQTQFNFIHYIYEDGSNDPIEDLVKEYKNKVSKLSAPFDVIYEKNPVNIGLNLATQHCIKQVNLPYFMWINCDDWLDKTFIENITKEIKKHPDVSVFRWNMYVHSESSISVRPCNHFQRKQLKIRNQRNSYLNGTFKFNHFLIKTEDYLKENPTCAFINKKDFFNDVQVLLPIILNGYKFGYAKKCYTNYLLRQNSEYWVNVKKEVDFNELFIELKQDKSKDFELKDKIGALQSNFDKNRVTKKYRASLKSISKFYSFIKANNLPLKDFRLNGHYKLTWMFILFVEKVLNIKR